jgi:hypothetical protein
MSFESTSWLWKPSEATNDGASPIMIDRCRQRDGTYKYAVRQSGAVMSNSGQWEHEPIPSSRDDDFLARCRFDYWDDAAKAIVKHCKPSGRFAAGVRTTLNPQEVS